VPNDGERSTEIKNFYHLLSTDYSLLPTDFCLLSAVHFPEGTSFDSLTFKLSGASRFDTKQGEQ
jgi:hypothetical protein